MPPAPSPSETGPPTERRVERARRARWNALVDLGYDATFVWEERPDGAYVVVDWPAAAEAMYGFPAAEALGHAPRELLGTRPARASWASIDRTLRDEGRWEGELVHTTAHGVRVLTESRLVRVAAEAANPLVVEIAHDLTARRVAEEALQASEERLAAIIGSAMDAIVTTDESQRVVLFNAAAEQLFGVEARDALGEPLDRFIPARFRRDHRSLVRAFGQSAASEPSPGGANPDGAASDGGRPIAHRGTVVALRADGTEFPVESAISHVATPQGHYYTVILHDVTEREHAERERDRLIRALEVERAQLAELAGRAETARHEADAARREAEAASLAKSAFLATMSHELRTPLNAVLGYAELLGLGMGGAVTPAQRRYVDRINASGKHLLGLINDVLDLAKIEAGQMRVRREAQWARAAVHEAIALVRPQADARGLALVESGRDGGPPPGTDHDDEDVAEPVGPRYQGDEHRVRQILANLLSNAVKYTDPGGRVEVSVGHELTHELTEEAAGAPRRWVTVRVRDTGMGIPPEQHELVFARFHQVDLDESGPYRRTRGGTGLGLAISRELARLMGGDLTVASAAGEGSTFTLWLPEATA